MRYQAVLDVKAYDPDQPRGWHGRWIRVGSVVRLQGGGRATVVGSGDWYRVRHANGHETTVHSRQIAAVVSTPDRLRREDRKQPLGVTPGRAADAADLNILDERLWQGSPRAGGARSPNWRRPTMTCSCGTGRWPSGRSPRT